MFIDTHCHLSIEDYDDIDKVVKEDIEAGVKKIIVSACTKNTFEEALALAKKYDSIYVTLGFHPSEVDTTDADLELLEELLKTDKVVGVGEIGLDYHYDNIDKALQQKWFEAQMNLARELNVPIVVHSRDAAQDTIAVMRQAKAGEIGGVVHCYSYTKETAREFLDMDFYFGIGGVVTFKNAKKLVEAVAYIPMERMVLETDSPYLSPIRSERNTSLNLPLVAEKIAEIKGISVQEVYDITWENAHKLYKIKERTQETGR